MTQNYVEEETLYLPNIKNGVTGLGDLWNCRRSKVVGFNALRVDPTGEYLNIAQKGNEEYILSHIKNSADKVNLIHIFGELKLDLLAGKIKIEGMAGFDKNDSDTTSTDLLICRYYLENYVVQLRKTARSIMDDNIVEKLIAREIDATHIVAGVVYGAEVDAEIRIEQTDFQSKLDIKGKLCGALIFGPVNAEIKIELQFLDNDENHGFRKEINMRSKPSLKSQPTTVEKMFALIDAMQTVISESKPLPEVDKKVTGVPVQFILVS